MASFEFVLYCFGIFIICFVLYQLLLADPIIPRRTKRNREFQQTIQVIDGSLKRIHERRRSEFNGAVIWSCRTKRFPFQITVRKGSPHQLVVSVHIDIPQLPSILETQIISGELDWDQPMTVENALQPVLKRLTFFDHVFIHKKEISMEKKFGSPRDLENWPDAFGGALTLSRYLLDYQRMPELQSTEICPYCKENIEKNELLVFCKECRTVHHRECWNETGHCTVFGCFNDNEVSIG